jgi:hypothetical protein
MSSRQLRFGNSVRLAHLYENFSAWVVRKEQRAHRDDLSNAFELHGQYRSLEAWLGARRFKGVVRQVVCGCWRNIAISLVDREVGVNGWLVCES